ncbi:MAG: MarR family transcriptional regulator [Pseudomonadota bacterium]
MKAYQQCDRQFALLLKAHELSTTQFDVLSSIHAQGPKVKLSDVANYLVVTKGNITGLVQRLQTMGLVTTQPCELDRRVTYCALTAKGRKKLSLAQVAASQFIQKQLEPFTDEECVQINALMRRMNAHLKTMDIDQINDLAKQHLKEHK